MSLKSPMKSSLASSIARSTNANPARCVPAWPNYSDHSGAAYVSRNALGIIRAKRRPVAGIATRDADMDLVALADRQRGGCDGRFERRFLRLVIVLRVPVVEDRPAVRLGDDHVFGQSHWSLLAVAECNVEPVSWFRWPALADDAGREGIRSLEDARVWRTALPAYQPRSGEYLRVSAPRFAQGHGAWPVLAPAPPAPRFANPAWVEPRPSCPSEKNRSGLIVCLFGSERWNPNCCGFGAVTAAGNQIARLLLPILEVSK